jgi:hypothetical protein
VSQYRSLMNPVHFHRIWIMLMKTTIWLKGQSHKKVYDIIPLNYRLDPNWDSPTVFKNLKSPVLKRRYFKQWNSRCKTGLSDFWGFCYTTSSKCTAWSEVLAPLSKIGNVIKSRKRESIEVAILIYSKDFLWLNCFAVKGTALRNNVYVYSILRRSAVRYSGPPRNLNIRFYIESPHVWKIVAFKWAILKF